MSAFTERSRPWVPEHIADRLTTYLEPLIANWTFTRTRTGCIRVQKGDFTAYLLEEEARALAEFIRDTDPA